MERGADAIVVCVCVWMERIFPGMDERGGGRGGGVWEEERGATTSFSGEEREEDQTSSGFAPKVHWVN